MFRAAVVFGQHRTSVALTAAGALPNEFQTPQCSAGFTVTRTQAPSASRKPCKMFRLAFALLFIHFMTDDKTLDRK
jgi:hypothetical protein